MNTFIQNYAIDYFRGQPIKINVKNVNIFKEKRWKGFFERRRLT